MSCPAMFRVVEAALAGGGTARAVALAVLAASVGDQGEAASAAAVELNNRSISQHGGRVERYWAATLTVKVRTVKVFAGM
jgi:hypothetical protein